MYQPGVRPSSCPLVCSSCRRAGCRVHGYLDELQLSRDAAGGFPEITMVIRWLTLALEQLCQETLTYINVSGRVGIAKRERMPIMAQSDADIQVKPRKRRVGKVGGDSAGSPLTAHQSMRAEEATDLANFLRALADPTRLQMVSLLAEHPGEVCVCDITRSFDLDQSTISHHLRLLREAGVIECVRHGVWAYYFFHAGALEPIKQLLKQLERLEMPG